MSSKPGIALIVLTFNEEQNLRQCLDSVTGLVREIWVVDSRSTDQTKAIAQSYGANVVERTFINQAEQFNWALDNLPIQSDWILRLDADEFLLPETRVEIEHTLRDVPVDVSGFEMKRRVVFMERWIRHGGIYPTLLLRLFRRGLGRSEMVEMDEHILLLQGRAGCLQNDFVDRNHKSLEFWVTKHESFATREARSLVQLRNGDTMGDVAPSLFGSQAARKRWLKTRIYANTPRFVRAIFYFGYRYVLRAGFLDGAEGLAFHFLQAFWYRFYVDAKLLELQRCAEGR